MLFSESKTSESCTQGNHEEANGETEPRNNMNSRRKKMDSWGKEENEQDLKKTTQLKGALENSHQHQEDRQRKRSYSQTNLTEVKCKKRFLLASLEGEECK